MLAGRRSAPARASGLRCDAGSGGGVIPARPHGRTVQTDPSGARAAGQERLSARRGLRSASGGDDEELWYGESARRCRTGGYVSTVQLEAGIYSQLQIKPQRTGGPLVWSGSDSLK